MGASVRPYSRAGMRKPVPQFWKRLVLGSIYEVAYDRDNKDRYHTHEP